MAKIAKELIDRLTAIASYLDTSGVLLGRGNPAQLAEVRNVIEKAHGRVMSAGDLVKALRDFKS